MTDSLKSIAAEDRANENVTDKLENPAEINFPASWAFTQISHLEEEKLGEIVSEPKPTLQHTSQREVVYDLGHSSVRVQPCHSRVRTDYQSVEEEDDLFLDVPEPSVLPKPTDACELNKVAALCLTLSVLQV